MERIPSFSVNHTNLQKGMYISRIDDPDIITYDIRMKLPNKEDYLTTGGMHTLEHLFATYARNSQYREGVVYVGPMGCRTGFYLILRGLDYESAIRLVQESMAFIAGYEGDIPGASEAECGNYLDQDLQEAKTVAADMAHVLAGWSQSRLNYAQ